MAVNFMCHLDAQTDGKALFLCVSVRAFVQEISTESAAPHPRVGGHHPVHRGPAQIQKVDAGKIFSLPELGCPPSFAL